MKTLILQLLPNTVLVLIIMTFQSCNKPEIKPPVPEKIRKVLSTHGHERIDDYYWMKDRENPAVEKYLRAENDYLDAMLKHTLPLQEKLFKEITGRIPQEDASVPFLHNGSYYYYRYLKAKEYPLLCRKRTLDGPEEIILDENKLAEGFEYFYMGSWAVSPDNKYIAYSVDTVGMRLYTLYIMELQSGKIIETISLNTSGEMEWSAENRFLFYVTKDEALRPYQVFRHRMGTPVKDDKLVYEEKDETFYTELTKSRDNKYIMIVLTHTLSSEYRYLDASMPEKDFSVFQPRKKDLLYEIDHLDGNFIIRTNYQAKNFRLMKAGAGKTQAEQWQEMVKYDEGIYFRMFEIFKGHVAMIESVKGVSRLRVLNTGNLSFSEVPFDEQSFEINFTGNHDPDLPKIRFTYSSPTTPPTVYDFDPVTGHKIMLKREEIPGGFNSKLYRTEKFYAKSKDGLEIPVSLVYRKDKGKLENRPFLMIGYGAYGFGYDPGFEGDVISLLDRGFVYAIAHIRGGDELGRQWYEDGRQLMKKNTFDDFIACARSLVKEGLADSTNLYAYGASAGGLLMGVVANMEPGLFKGIVAGVPFVDVVSTMLDPDIPLTTGEYDEWGNPGIREYYDYMLSYSPYDQVKKQAYPNMLVTAGFHDSQVQYWEPAKWVPRLRENNTGPNKIYLYTNMNYGHSGASGRFEQYREIALYYAFILDLAEITE